MDRTVFGQAERLLLNTALISILSYEHDCSDEPVITLWNSEANESFCPAPVPASVTTKGTKL